jgi:competence protein ComEC
LASDIEVGTEQQLMASGVPLASTVLEAAHHGSCTSSTQAFLDAVDPELVVISVGAERAARGGIAAQYGIPLPGACTPLAGVGTALVA